MNYYEYFVDRIPELGYRRGGNASNSSSVLAQLGLKSEFLGTLSSSIELDFIKKDFADHSVSIEHCPVLPYCEIPTSMVMINSSNGSRTILHHPKNMQELSFQHFTKLDLSNYTWIHFEVKDMNMGEQLFRQITIFYRFFFQGRCGNVENIKKMIESVRKHSTAIRISVELENPQPVLNELVRLGDVVFLSKEFAQFSGFRSMNEAVKGFIGFVKPG